MAEMVTSAMVREAVSRIISGRSLIYHVLHPGGQFHVFDIRPMGFDERGLEVILSFVYQDCKVPKNSFRLGFMLRVSESTNIIRTSIKCLRQRQISVSEYSCQLQRSTAATGNADTSTSPEIFPPLKLVILLMPHHPLEDPKSTSEDSAIEAIDGEK
ncbi:unnamed protein product [Triticum aestivum]|uniref:(bread wheat) hypothetical protein n=1 Tax=Triticum aestivum TaxID=4565 RepID=A0A7G2IHK1_WHEAT|nr:unnamed protein product [Triticum aestivum]